MTPTPSWQSTVAIVLVLVAAAGCAKERPNASPELTAEEVAATREAVTAFIRAEVLADDSFKGDSVACSRVAEALRERYSYDYGGWMCVADTTITQYAIEQHLSTRRSACFLPSVKSAATLDTLIVQVLSRYGGGWQSRRGERGSVFGAEAHRGWLASCRRDGQSHRGAAVGASAGMAASRVVSRCDGGVGYLPSPDASEGMDPDILHHRTHMGIDDSEIADLTALFTKLGAPGPAGWARSQVREGIPQVARFLFLRAAWRRIIADSDTAWIDTTIAATDADPTAPFAGVGAALARLRSQGATDADLTEVVRGMQVATLFSLTELLDDPGELEPEVADVGWALVQVGPEGEVLAQVSGLHESILETDPTGREMRPRSDV